VKKLTLPLLLCVLIIGALIWVLTGPGDAPDADLTDPLGTVETDRPDELTGDRHPDERRSPAGADNRENGTARVGAGGKIQVRGRCVSAETRLPLSGCEIDVAAVRRRSMRHGDSEQPTTAAPRTHTGPDGRFAVEIEMPSRHHIRLRTKMTGRADMQGFLPRRRGVADAGDIAIPTGVRLVARVVDKQSAPQRDISFRFYRAMTGGRPTVAPVNWLNYTSDGAGVIDSDVMLANGIWNVTPQGSVRILEPGRRFEIPSNTSMHEMRFVIELPDPKAMISGRLFDDSGRGVGNIAIHAEDGSKWPIGYGTSDQEGKFRIRCRTKPGEPVHLAVPRASGFETLRSAVTYPWGSKNVTLTLKRAGSLTITVVEDSGDRPIEDYKVVWFKIRESGVGGYPGSRGPMGHHPDGKVELEGVPAGKIRVVVMPQGKTYASNDPYEFEKPPGDSAIRIELGTRVELPVVVVDRQDRPIAGTRLTLVQPMDGKPVTLGSFAVDHSHYPQFSNPNSYALMLDHAVTDKSGSAVLRWTASGDALAIRAVGATHVPMVHAPISIRTKNRTVKIVVSGGASLSGAVAPIAVLEQLMTKAPSRKFAPQAPTIILKRVGTDGPQGSHRTKSTRVDDKGEFRLLGLHPGKWEVTFRVWRFGAGRGSNVSQKKFPPIELTDDEHRRLTLDIDDMRPARLTGQVLVNGSPWTQKSIVLTKLNELDGGRLQSGAAVFLTTDDRGAFAAVAIQPGRYRVGIDNQKSGRLRPRWLVSAADVEVPPGGTVDRVFRVEFGKLRLRLTDKNGNPVAKQYLSLHHKRGASTSGATTGDDGRVEIDPISAGIYTVGVFPRVKAEPGRLKAPRRNQEIVLGEVTVAAGAAVTEVTLTVPDLDANRDKLP
jgi:hypothetical protein